MRISNEKLEKSIKEFLISKGNYNESDDILINELLFNIALIKQCKVDIKNEGYKINITQNPDKEPYYVRNQSVIVYTNCMKELKSLFQALGISPRERSKLSLELPDKDDEFEKDFSK